MKKFKIVVCLWFIVFTLVAVLPSQAKNYEPVEEGENIFIIPLSIKVEDKEFTVNIVGRLSLFDNDKKYKNKRDQIANFAFEISDYMRTNTEFKWSLSKTPNLAGEILIYMSPRGDKPHARSVFFNSNINKWKGVEQGANDYLDVIVNRILRNQIIEYLQK